VIVKKVPADPKSEWGFTADDVKAKIEELCQAEGIPIGTPHKNISLSKIGALLGLQVVSFLSLSLFHSFTLSFSICIDVRRSFKQTVFVFFLFTVLTDSLCFSVYFPTGKVEK
jgi:hypothetical protein